MDETIEGKTERETIRTQAPPSAATPAPFSVAAGFLGWSVATFFTLVFAAIVLGLIGNAAYGHAPGTAVAQASLENLTTAGVLGILVAVFLGFLVGGYNAGRIDRWHGVAQGAVVVGWTVLFGMAAAILANAAVDTYNLAFYLTPFSVNWNDLAARSALGILIALVVMLAGAVLGGFAAARWARPVVVAQRRRFGYWRGRPRV